MPDNHVQPEQSESLLFRFCGSAEAYRRAKHAIEEQARADSRRRVAPTSYDCRISQDGVSSIAPDRITVNLVGPPLQSVPPQHSAADLARLRQLVRDYPDAVREILAPVILDIIEAYFGGNEVDLATEGQGTQG